MRHRMKLLFIPLAIAAFFGVTYIVMELWNNILPGVLHIGTITYWQAMGIFVLCKILFGFGHRGGRGGAPWMRGRMQERFKNMSPEERAKFREKWEQGGAMFRKEWCGPAGGRRHPFEQEWEKGAAEEAPKPTE
jgi:hypothetical protein